MTQTATTASAGVKPIRSDPTLLADIRRFGRFDTTGCYQCGTCTLSCDLVAGSATFPRRIIRYGLLGLRGPLQASLEPWLCHDCGTCSTACPRQAQPHLAMQTLRHYLIGRYDFTGLAARVMRSRAWHLGALGLAAALTLALIVFYHLWRVQMSLSDFVVTDYPFDHMFPTMKHFTVVVVLLPFAMVLSSAGRMWWLTMGGGPVRVPARHYLAEARMLIAQAVTHERMRKCPEKSRWHKHWFMALGMVAKLFIIVFFLEWFQTAALQPLYLPQRWVGYLVAALILYGTVDLLVGRLRRKRLIYQQGSELSDLVFPVLLLLTAVSGLFAHVFRYAGLGLAAHYAYASHIVIAVPMLVVEIPFGTFSHMIYRPLALYLQAVKDRAASPAGDAEAVADHG